MFLNDYLAFGYRVKNARLGCRILKHDAQIGGKPCPSVDFHNGILLYPFQDIPGHVSLDGVVWYNYVWYCMYVLA